MRGKRAEIFEIGFLFDAPSPEGKKQRWKRLFLNHVQTIVSATYVNNVSESPQPAGLEWGALKLARQIEMPRNGGTDVGEA